MDELNDELKDEPKESPIGCFSAAPLFAFLGAIAVIAYLLF
jgi:hypothetical protein